MKTLTAAALIGAVVSGGAGWGAEAAELTSDQAVAVALQRNRDVIAARLEIDASELDVVAARIYPNPTFEYAIGNLVLGTPNTTQNAGVPAALGFFGQPVQTVGVSEIVDVWMKRSARTRAAEKGVDHRRLLTEDALREIAYAVRSSFAETVREQDERQMAHDFADRYAQTIKVSQARFKAGDISEADLRKIELEGLRYQNAVIDAEMQLDVARGRLAALLTLPSAAQLPALHPDLADAASRPRFDLTRLTQRALERRPDLRAAGAARVVADAQLASAERDRLPDIVVGGSYTHSDFTVSGDNPNTMALTLSLPLPLFDRNQANIGRAQLEQRRADNDGERLRIAVARDVAEAVRKGSRAATLLSVFERPAGGDVPGAPTGTSDKGGMLSRSETALRVAEKSYRAGAISLIELLEAQRTYLDTQAQYLRALYDFRQATADVSHAVGEP